MPRLGAGEIRNLWERRRVCKNGRMKRVNSSRAEAYNSTLIEKVELEAA